MEFESVSGRTIRLSEKVWYSKIQKDHPEFKENDEYLNEIRKTIEDPEYVVKGWSGEFLALRNSKIAPRTPKYLCVVYREINDHGFLITTFFISKVHKLLRRGIVWSKPM